MEPPSTQPLHREKYTQKKTLGLSGKKKTRSIPAGRPGPNASTLGPEGPRLTFSNGPPVAVAPEKKQGFRNLLPVVKLVAWKKYVFFLVLEARLG